MAFLSTSRSVFPGLRLLASSARAPTIGRRSISSLNNFTDEENLFRNEVRKFAHERIEPLSRKMDEEKKMDPELIQACFDAGFMGVETPAELGGAGANFTSSIILIDELARVDPAVSVMVDVQNTLVSTCIRKWGTPEQHKKWLPDLATKHLGSFGLSEWGSGSDAFAMTTKATDKGDHFILEGGKAWITNAAEAGTFVIFANVDPSQGYRGITAFIVPRSAPGFSVGKPEDKLGIRASSTCELVLDKVPVPRTDVLGAVGKGYKIAIECLNEGRIGIGAQMLGLAAGCLDQTLPYLNQRKQFGREISGFQGMQFQFAQAAVEIEAARLLVYNAARLQEEKKPFVQEASMAKLYASQVAERVSSACINMMGGVGFTKDFPIERFFRDSKIGQIYEGTSNIQLETIAKQLLRNLSK